MKKTFFILAVLTAPLLLLLQGCPAPAPTTPAPTPTATVCTDLAGHTCTPTDTFTPTTTPTVTPVPPVIDPIPPQTASDSGSPLQLVLAASDSNPVAFSILTQPSHAIASISGNTCTYTPNSTYQGKDFFSFKATDTVTGAFASEGVTITDIP